MATTTTVLKARVERGAALLDAEQPGWAPRIDVPTLNLASPSQCILAQLYGPGWSRVLGINHFDCGFCTGDYSEFPRLLPLWREAIEARCDVTEAR